jgi:hypothetical protein
VGNVELSFVLWEVAESKVLVCHGEHARREMCRVGLAFASDVAGAPAWVDEFPEPIIYFDGIPRVSRRL